MPRHRPPYVAQVGIFGRPTLVNNIETLYWVREDPGERRDWFAMAARTARKGLRSYSVSGRVANPGVVLAAAGITVRELIANSAAAWRTATLQGLSAGRRVGRYPARVDGRHPARFRPLEKHGCFVGSHAVVILSDKDNMKDVAFNLMRFFEDESCGQCTPCRNGTEKAVKLMAPGVGHGAARRTLQVMRDASICGLGQAALQPADERHQVLPR